MKSPHSPHATQIVGVTTGVTTSASPTPVDEDADVIVPATTVTTGHGVTRAAICFVLHAMKIATTDAVDTIRVVDVIRIAGATTTVDATKAAGVTAEGTAAANTMPMSWTRTVTNPDPAHETGMIAPLHDLTSAPGDPGPPTGAEARDEPRSKYIGDFQAQIKDHNVWPCPALSAHVRWNKEQSRKACTLDMQGKKVGFGSWYNRQYDDYTCEEYCAPQDHKDRVRTVDLTPEDAINRELKDDDSLRDSDWRERKGRYLLRLGTVPSNLRPNRKKAMICFEGNDRKFLPTAYAAEDRRRTVDQMMPFLGQTNFVQGRMGNESTPERHAKKTDNKRK